jgi:hypothetical protein
MASERPLSRLFCVAASRLMRKREGREERVDDPSAAVLASSQSIVVE